MDDDTRYRSVRFVMRMLRLLRSSSRRRCCARHHAYCHDGLRRRPTHRWRCGTTIPFYRDESVGSSWKRNFDCAAKWTAYTTVDRCPTGVGMPGPLLHGGSTVTQEKIVPSSFRQGDISRWNGRARRRCSNYRVTTTNRNPNEHCKYIS